ncbi:LacI family DNA-binding transcriptional regulator [Leisingera sp. JC11]|uniref:LacI family DNA-binding transcriptional regulator n=1 Tax=Leisingera sp. JC11 TaxID=3042469 RepID=UPI00345158D0
MDTGGSDGQKEKISPKRPTIYDLAELAGTSPSAVSSVLNGTWKKRRISEKLAKRISKIAEEQGYAVNIQASVLRRVRSNIIGMIMPKYDNRYFGAIAEQFEALARARGLFPVITCTQREPELEFEAARELVSYQVDCLISTGATDPDRISEFCAAAGVRSINLDLPGSKAPSVVSDNFAGARDLTRLLLQRFAAPAAEGQPLLFIGGRGSDHNTAERIRGFEAAHAEFGIPLPPENILPCGYAAQKAEDALDAFPSSLPAGLFVNSTITLEGVIRWQARNPSRAFEFGCFDWDPFAALLPGNVGMVQQDVAGMLAKVFELTATEASPDLNVEIPCIIKRLGGQG